MTSSDSQVVPEILLNNGVRIPQLGFGVYQVDAAETVRAVRTALNVGYRHIDTAQMYGNEAQVGEAIRSSDVPRSEVFITSKLANNCHAHDDALAAFQRTLAALQVDRIDLFLIHWPLPSIGDFVETWRAMEEIYRQGGAAAIGVSNFNAPHLRRLHAETDIVPAVNQIEAHPFLTQEPLRAFGAEHGIATEAWSPIAQGAVLKDPVINEVARRVGKTAAQVVLRWHIQLGNIIFPKSVTEERVRENFEIFDFELSAADLGQISALNRDERTGPDPDTFAYLPA